jgi:hypothetical protein
MAHPDSTRAGSEQGQRQHSGPTTEASDAGMQTHSQGASGKGPTLSDPGHGPGDERHGPTSPQVRSDSDGAVPDTGMDRDSGAGTAGGRDAGGREASRNAQRAGQGDRQ